MVNAQPPPAVPANRLLARLPRHEHEGLGAHLQPVPFQPKQVLYPARSRMDHVYFPVRGVVSAMTIMADGSAIEVATVVNEGMAGLAAFVGVEASPNEVTVQVEGEGLRMTAEALRKEARAGHPRRG